MTRKSTPKLIQQLIHVLEPGRRAGLEFGLGLPDFAEEDGAAESAEFGLIALIPIGVHDVRGLARTLEDDRRFIAGLHVVDNFGHSLSQIADRNALHHTFECTIYRTSVNASQSRSLALSRRDSEAADARGASEYVS